MPEPDHQLTSLAQKQILEDLTSRGFSPTLKDGEVDLGVGSIRFRCSVPELQEHPGAFVACVQWELSVPASQGIPIQDSAGGTAETKEKAVVAAVRAWIDGVLPPVAIACGIGQKSDVHPYDLCQIDFENNLINEWEVFAGPFQVAGPDREHLAGHLEQQQPFTMLLTDGALPPLPATPGLFWLKLFQCRQESGVTSTECRLNNQDWPAGADALQKFAWPTEPGLLLFKQFIVGKLNNSGPYKPDKKWWHFWK